MDGRDMYSEGVRTLWSISTKFACQMMLLNYARPLFHAWVSYIENLSFLTEENLKVCGSRGEGIWFPFGLIDYRDIDFIRTYPKTLAVEIGSETERNDQDIYLYLVDREGSLPGYCRLRQLHHSSSLFMSQLHITKEFNGINYLLSTWPRHLLKIGNSCQHLINNFSYGYPAFALGSMVESGPSISREIRGLELQPGLFSFGYNITKIDHLFVIHHPKWPSCASEWRDRIRFYGWPSQQQITNITKKGIYLASVGSFQSELEEIEWRYSFNEAERELVRSFNCTQINCYVLLKMLVSEYITSHFDDDVISSYHIKTLTFWAVEQSDPQLWVPHNLVELVFRILNVLFDCVAKLSCPSYFIPDENLFAGKITPVNRGPVSQILLKVMNEGWVALTRLKPFATHEDFVQSLYEDTDFLYLRGCEEKQFFDEIKITKLLYYFSSAYTVERMLHILYPISCCSITETDKMDEYFNEVIHKLLQILHLSDNDRDKETLQNILAFVRCIYGTFFLSLSRCLSLERKDNCIMEKIGLVYTSHASKSNLVECIAKYANYTYMTGDFQSTIEAANQLLDRYERFPLQPPGVPRSYQALGKFLEATLSNTNIHGRSVFDLFDNHCLMGWIIFLKNEIYALPFDARVELFYVIRKGNQLQTICRNWFGFSPFVYVAYLAFLINIGRGLEQEAKVYLNRMEIIWGNSNSYESSSINLIGASYVTWGQHDKAMKMFLISMKRQREEPNAAVWHVARLLWRKLLDRWTEST